MENTIFDILSKEDEDATCSICNDTYTDPRILPCTHTFCIKCLQEADLKANTQSSDDIPCPICTHIFQIPSEGFTGLPKTSFMERLTPVTQASVPTPGDLCDACSEKNEDEAVEHAPTANAFCIDCQQKFCEECEKFHRKLKLCRHHKLLPISEQNDYTGSVINDVVQTVCEQHDQRVLEVYCAECKVVVCTICFLENHEGHKGSHVSRVVDQFRKELVSNIETIKACLSEAQIRKLELLAASEGFRKNLLDLECDVEKRVDSLKEIAEKHAMYLKKELSSIKEELSTDLQAELDDFDAYLLRADSYFSRCTRVLRYGSTIDTCRNISDLSARKKELTEDSHCFFVREILPFGPDPSLRISQLEAFLEEENWSMIAEIKEKGGLNSLKQVKLTEEQRSYKEADAPTCKAKSKHTRTEMEDFRVKFEALLLNLNIERDARSIIMTELSEEKANRSEYKDTLRQERDTNYTLIVHNVALKQELENAILASSKHEEVNTSLKERLSNEHLTIKTLQETNDQIKLVFKSEKMANVKLKQDLDMVKLASKRLEQETTSLKESLSNEQLTAKTQQENFDRILVKLDSEKMKNIDLHELLKNEKSNARKLQKSFDRTKRRLERAKEKYRRLREESD